MHTGIKWHVQLEDESRVHEAFITAENSRHLICPISCDRDAPNCWK